MGKPAPALKVNLPWVTWHTVCSCGLLPPALHSQRKPLLCRQVQGCSQLLVKLCHTGSGPLELVHCRWLGTGRERGAGQCVCNQLAARLQQAAQQALRHRTWPTEAHALHAGCLGLAGGGLLDSIWSLCLQLACSEAAAGCSASCVRLELIL